MRDIAPGIVVTIVLSMISANCSANTCPTRHQLRHDLCRPGFGDDRAGCFSTSSRRSSFSAARSTASSPMGGLSLQTQSPRQRARTDRLQQKVVGASRTRRFFILVTTRHADNAQRLRFAALAQPLDRGHAIDTGNTISISTTSNVARAAAFSAASPLSANSTWHPSSDRTVLNTTRANGLSSTQSTLGASASTLRRRVASDRARRRHVQDELSARSPRRRAGFHGDIATHRARDLLNRSEPKPAPPKRAAISAPACENGLNNCLRSPALMPIPVSDTVNVALTVSPRAVVLTCKPTRPRAVNFTALSIRFSSAARKPHHIADNHNGRSAARRA